MHIFNIAGGRITFQFNSLMSMSIYQMIQMFLFGVLLVDSSKKWRPVVNPNVDVFQHTDHPWHFDLDPFDVAFLSKACGHQRLRQLEVDFFPWRFFRALWMERLRFSEIFNALNNCIGVISRMMMKRYSMMAQERRNSRIEGSYNWK